MEPGPAKHAARSRVLRRGALVLAAYAVGLLASCAVAWGISAYYTWKFQAPFGFPGPDWFDGNAMPSGRLPVYRCEADGVPVVFGLYSMPGSQFCFGRPSTGDFPFRPIPRWVVVDSTTLNVVVSTEATGWPALCLKYSWVTPSVRKGRDAATASIPYLGAWSPLDRGNPRLKLPLIPIATGLAINTAFYGTLVLAGLCLPAWARSALRRRGGRCGACGYDRRGLTGEPCPECGAVPA